jgi:alkaline phosphatase
MVEGGRIDHAHHAGNAHRALHDTIAFSDAVRVAREATDPKHTLIVVTADHSHVFTLAGYPTRGNPIFGMVSGNDDRGEPTGSFSEDAAGRPYTTLGYHNGPGARGSVVRQDGGPIHSGETGGDRSAVRRRPDLADVDTAAPNFLQEAAIPLGYETHSSEDVPAYASGPGAALFSGVREQHYIFHALVAAWGWSDDGSGAQQKP